MIKRMLHFSNKQHGFTLMEMVIAMALMGIIFVGLGYMIKGNSRSTQELSRSIDAQSELKIINAQIKKDLVNAGAGIPETNSWGYYKDNKLSIHYIDALKKTCQVGTSSSVAPEKLVIKYFVEPAINAGNEDSYGTQFTRTKKCGSSTATSTVLLKVPEGIRVVYTYYKFNPSGPDIVVSSGSSERPSYVIIDISVKTKEVGSGAPIIRKISTKVQILNA